MLRWVQAAGLAWTGFLHAENKETIYNSEERKLLEVNQNVRDLIQELEQKDDAKTQ